MLLQRPPCIGGLRHSARDSFVGRSIDYDSSLNGSPRKNCFAPRLVERATRALQSGQPSTCCFNAVRSGPVRSCAVTASRARCGPESASCSSKSWSNTVSCWCSSSVSAETNDSLVPASAARCSGNGRTVPLDGYSSIPSTSCCWSGESWPFPDADSPGIRLLEVRVLCVILTNLFDQS